jgi:hypothetical protein
MMNRGSTAEDIYSSMTALMMPIIPTEAFSASGTLTDEMITALCT